MWTDSKLIKSLMFSVLFGAAGTVVAAIPTSPETMVVQQGNKVSGLVSDDMGSLYLSGRGNSPQGSDGSLTEVFYLMHDRSPTLSFF